MLVAESIDDSDYEEDEEIISKERNIEDTTELDNNDESLQQK